MGFQFSFSLVNLMDPNAPVQTPLMGQMFGLLGTLTVLGAGSTGRCWPLCCGLSPRRRWGR